MRKEYSHQTFNYGNFKIYAHTYETQYNWGHVCAIVDNATYNTISSAKAVYYNRTWERYQYQSVILSAIRNLIDYHKNTLYNNYRITTGKKRLTQQEKDTIIKNDNSLKTYNDMYNYFDKEI